MNKEEIKEILNNCNKAINEASGYNDTTNKLLNYIEQLEKENQQLKKQKDDVIEYIENTDDFDIEIFDESTGGCLGYDLSKGAKNILKMLGEMDG